MSPFHEIIHWQHAEGKSPHKGLSPYNWEEHVSGGAGDQAVLKASILILWNPFLALLQVRLGNRTNIAFVNKEVNELSLLLPGW